MNENPQSNYAWEDRLMWFKSSSENRTLYRIVGEPMEFEWNIFPGFTTLQICNKVQEFLSNMSREPDDFTGRIIFMTMFNDISWGSKENERECELSALLVSMYAKRFSPGKWSFLGPGIRKEVVFYSRIQTTRRMGQSRWADDDGILRKRTPSFPCYESIVTRNVQKQRWWTIIKKGTIETVFRTIIPANQLSFYGAVSNLCEECKTCHVRTGRLVLVGQPDPLFVPTSVVKKHLYL